MGSENNIFAPSAMNSNFATIVPDDTTLRKQILDIVETFTCMSQYSEMKAFFSSASNISGIKDAVEIYGIPPANRQSYHSGLWYYGKWHDFCDWDRGMYKFYLAARFFMSYPNIPANQGNCQRIAELQASINDEIVSADRKYAADNDANYHNYMLSVINDRITYYNGLYSNMNCSLYISEQLQAKQQAIAETTMDKSLQSNVAALKAATALQGTGSTMGLYFLYGVGGLVAVLVIAKILKK